MRVCNWVGRLLSGFILVSALAAAEPPPAIDARLDEWENVPNAYTIQTRQQVVHGRDAWKSAQDLSAKVWPAWRHEYRISDTDGGQSAQEKLMTIETAPWAHLRSRLMAAALTPADGKVPSGQRRTGFFTLRW
jgi:hypothetical protein